MALLTIEGWLFILRWIHLLAGITWVGLLYYFNFVQTPFFAETEAIIRTGTIQKLVPRALWWFRWSAMVTFLAGILIYLHRWAQLGTTTFFTSSYGLTITVGGLLGTIMFLNVWLVIWPNQKVVIKVTTQMAPGYLALPDAAGAARRGALASRTNVVFSIPMIFYMIAASHYPLLTTQANSASISRFWLVTLAIVAVIEMNALVGTQGVTKKPLDTVSGTICAGFILTAVFYLLSMFIAPSCEHNITMCVSGIEYCCHDGRPIGACTGFWRCP